jgi:hypothetical protein
VLGFFSFTEVTDPTAHRAYNEWHRLDHLPEQYSLDGLLFGQRWVCTPACRDARVAVSPLLQSCHYMTLYLMRGPDVLPGFFDLAQRLRRADRFFAERRAHLSGHFEVQDRWVSPRVTVSAAVIPHRPARGIYVVVGPRLDGAAMVAHEGVAGAWAFTDADPDPDADPDADTDADADHDPQRTITVAFIDGDLTTTAQALGRWCLDHSPATGRPMEWAGPLAGLDTDTYDWFDRLTPQ